MAGSCTFQEVGNGYTFAPSSPTPKVWAGATQQDPDPEGMLGSSLPKKWERQSP